MFPNKLNQIIINKFTRYYSTKTTSNWESVVGLEVHAQILSKSKLFSSSSSSFQSAVNKNVSLHDASIPGTLPVLNKKCIEAGIMTALALNCKINLISMFDRKHYFYGDMPSGYQITQQRNPLANNGIFNFYVYTPEIHKTPYIKTTKIKQIQLEQDSGKSLHDDDRSLVDLNRAGMGLMEIVFEPDLKDGEEAAALVKELSLILKRIGTCSSKMEEGAIRVDANVSIHKKNEPLGIRTEIKNINSIRGVASAIKYEIERQIKLKENGEELINETRSWNAILKKTVSMRDKEEKQDYRYMPEPNLPPLYLSIGEIKQGSVNIDDMKKLIPELPQQTRDKFMKELGLTIQQVIILVSDEILLQYFNDCLKFKQLNPKILANILIFEFLNVVKEMDVNPEDFLHKSDFLAEIVNLFETKKINRGTTRYLIEELFKNNQLNPIQIVEENNLYQITDELILTKICQEIIQENLDLIKLYKKQKIKVYKKLMSNIVTKTNQRADMAKCDEIMKKLLNKYL